MQITATALGDRWITTGRVPITDFMSTTYGPGYVTWRIQIWSSVARSVQLSVIGDVGNGTPVTIIPATSFTETAGHWTIMTVSAAVNPYPNGPTKQAAYYWLFPVIHIVGAAANESHYVTLMGLWPCTPMDIGINTGTTPFDYPRNVKVTLSPQAANLLSNTLTNFTYGFDGISPAVDPTQSSINYTCGLAIDYTSAENPGISVNGIGALQVSATAPGATVWFGLVNAWTQPPPTIPQGWFSNATYSGWPVPPSDLGDWFPGEVVVAVSRLWFDPVNGWFFMPGPDGSTHSYFSLSAGETQGHWFPGGAQPPLNGNLGPFTVPAYQGFNFSVYADYLSVTDPSNAVMQIGFRWYYPDNTWIEVYYSYTLTGTMTRYSCPPTDPTSVWMGNPPVEPVTMAEPTFMYPFVRFPNASSAQFILNSAMLSPGTTLLPYFDTTMFPGDPDYIEDSHGASYYYAQRDPRTLRLESLLYKWIPMGASHTEIFGAGGALEPLDPTQWQHPAVAFHGTSTLSATPS